MIEMEAYEVIEEVETLSENKIKRMRSGKKNETKIILKKSRY